MSNAMAPEISFLDDYEFDENDVFDSDSSLIEFSNVESDSSEYQTNHWADDLVAPQRFLVPLRLTWWHMYYG